MKIDKTLFVLALGVFGITTTEFGVIGVLPDLASEFGISIDRAGLLLSAFAIIIAVFGPFMIMLFSKFDKKRLLVISLCIFALSNLLTAFATNFYFMLIIRMLPAFFHPVYWSIALAVAAKTGKGNTSKSVSTIFGGLTIATVLGVPLSTLIADLFSWQMSFVVLALLNLVTALGLLIFLPPVKIHQNGNSKNTGQVLKSGLLWLNFVLVFLMITAMYSTYGYMAAFLETVSGLDGKQISFMLLLFGVTGIYGNKLAGKYMGQYPQQTTLIFIGLLLGSHLLLYFYAAHFVILVFLVAIWGLVHTGGFLIGNINLTSSVSGAPELVNSIFTSCGNFAVTAGSLIGGYWVAHYGMLNIVWSSILFLMLSIAIFILKKKALKFSYINQQG